MVEGVDGVVLLGDVLDGFVVPEFGCGVVSGIDPGAVEFGVPLSGVVLGAVVESGGVLAGGVGVGVPGVGFWVEPD